MSEFNYEVVLSSGKKVIVREPEMGDRERAAQVAGSKYGDNQFAFALGLQNEIVKLLLISIDGKRLSGQEKELIKGLFSSKEYDELILGVNEIMGKPEKPQVNLVSSCGDK